MFGAHRLPGIAFQEVETPAPEALPRMDVALFAGFAAMGPVHRPVPVADFAGFCRIFGEDCPLAFDEARGELVTAALAPAVRAFFANGGRRCWVVRVARTTELEALLGRSRGTAPRNDGIASTGRFEIGPFIALRQDGSIDSATAQARSVGSWSDALAVATRVERSPFSYRSLVRADAAKTLLIAGEHDVSFDQVEFETSSTLNLGELVQFEDELGTIYGAVERVDGRRARAALLVEIASSSPPEQSPSTASSPPESLPKATRIPVANARAWRVTAGVQVDAGTERAVVGGIGLTQLHPNSWWKFLPDDLRANSAEAPALLIAAESADLDAKTAPMAWLPWLPASDGRFSEATRAEDNGRSSLERDGLSRFDEDLFLDPVLAQVGSARVAEEAERILHLEGRRLFGIHSVLGINDGGDFSPVSLLAVPDACQTGWVERARDAPATPQSEVVPPAHWFDHRGPCAQVRVQSPPREDLDRSGFLDCVTRILPAPAFKPIEARRKPGFVELGWTDAEPGANYVLEIARSADFAGAEIVHEGPGTTRVVNLETEGFYYFRLRARLGDEVSRSALLVLTVSASDWTSTATKDFNSSALLSVQRALLRLTSASGEMFALLSLPRHYRIAEAVDHMRQLRTLGGAFGGGMQLGWNERRALSFGALYHPWVVSPSDVRGLVAAPPDGALAGVHARRTRERGAWIAAANERLRDVVAIDASVHQSEWPQADENGLNLIRRDPRGFLVLDSDTLSDEAEWRQINVRRLMSLLRRVAVRRGATYVFEPNGDVLRRAVERGFNELLERLFTLGAFAGGKSDEAYQLAVTTTPGDRDAGRLVVEIRVAPSQPLRFLIVRLVQSGGRFAVTAED
jgi:hypothetical protein